MLVFRALIDALTRSDALLLESALGVPTKASAAGTAPSRRFDSLGVERVRARHRLHAAGASAVPLGAAPQPTPDGHRWAGYGRLSAGSRHRSRDPVMRWQSLPEAPQHGV